MIQVSISGMVLVVGIPFLVGMAVGIFGMIRVVKRELAKEEKL